MKTNYTFRQDSKGIYITTSKSQLESPISVLSTIISRFASKVWSVYIDGVYVTPSSTKSPTKEVKVLVSSSLKQQKAT